MKFKLFAVICIFYFYTSAQENKKDYSEAFKIIEVWLDAQKDYEKLPGISAAIIKDQEIIWSGAFGKANIEANVNTETNTICSICSISKLFTATAIMKLYDEGKLRLDDKVSDLLPWYNLDQKYSDSGPITVRSLLTHSSGLPREANFPYWTGPDFPFPTQEEIKKELGNQETLYPASTYFQYSNLGLTLLGEIVEQVSGISFTTYVEEQIIKPLQLNDTRTQLPENLYGSQLAIGYSSLNRQGQRQKVKLFQANGIGAAAGFSSNVLDLGKFASWQFRLMDSTITEIIKPSTLKYMQQVHWTDPDWKTTWGLGFSVYKGSDGTKWVSHGGSCPGYRSGIQINPKSKMAYTVMINANGTNPHKYAIAMHAILNKVKDESKKSKVVETSKIDLTDYTGYYSNQPWGSESYISSWEGKLVLLRLPSQSPAKSMVFLKHVQGDRFQKIRKDE
ncbi:MAG: serine hydrolase domain-containing protein [Eudoraea sp.]|uniref:serine hydrolase domain-containing protein n=1 Tax=Eudoraea sp. TaxID=1979955 RepID=UPI003C74A6C7